MVRCPEKTSTLSDTITTDDGIETIYETIGLQLAWTPGLPITDTIPYSILRFSGFLALLERIQRRH